MLLAALPSGVLSGLKCFDSMREGVVNCERCAVEMRSLVQGHQACAEYLLLNLISVCRISKSVANRKVGVEKKK